MAEAAQSRRHPDLEEYETRADSKLSGAEDISLEIIQPQKEKKTYLSFYSKRGTFNPFGELTDLSD